MGARRQGRILAFQSLYRYDLSAAPLEELLDFSWQNRELSAANTEEGRAFARLLITGSLDKLPEIDTVIREQLENWDFERLARVDVAILRISVYCLLYQRDIPASVTIDEAVTIAKVFGSDDSYRFINGVLDAVSKKHRGDG
ncbi:MAG TPA: transcription antitermination factor NusB [Spirochaetia bacterium]|nr:transcription antitermination factor NusB [Spirochaetia bacterium]